MQQRQLYVRVFVWLDVNNYSKRPNDGGVMKTRIDEGIPQYGEKSVNWWWLEFDLLWFVGFKVIKYRIFDFYKCNWFIIMYSTRVVCNARKLILNITRM